MSHLFLNGTALFVLCDFESGLFEQICIKRENDIQWD